MQAVRRPATTEERALVKWLITHARVGSEYPPFLEQVALLQVVARCECGCPSVDFEPHGQVLGATAVAGASGNSPEGVPIGVTLWSRSGHISGLEVYCQSESTSFTLPRPEDLKPSSERAGGLSLGHNDR
jgi:hypothetical protein